VPQVKLARNLTFHFERILVEAQEGVYQRARGETVPLHQLARPRRAVPPSARAHLHQEVGGGQST